MAVFRISETTGLSFKRIEDLIRLQNDNNRLYLDYEYPFRTVANYVQKYNFLDVVFIQFKTDYTNFTVQLIGENGYLYDYDLTGLSLPECETGYTCYNVNILPHPEALQEGCYYLKIETFDLDKPKATFITETILLKDSHPNTLKIEYYDSEYNDGILWDEDFMTLRLEGEIREMQGGQDKTTYEDDNHNIVTTKGQPLNVRKLQFGELPEYLIKKIDIALNHNYFLVNEVRYNTPEPLEREILEKTWLYESSVVLTQWDYENYNKNIEITGDLPVLLGARTYGDEAGEYRLFNDNSDVLYYTYD